MKILIISDIHGSSYYAEKIKEIDQQEEPDKIILLGDLYYHGPRNDLTQEYNPMKVAGILNDFGEKVRTVRGNCDSEVDDMVTEFPIMSDYKSINIDGTTFYLTHGHLLDKYEKLFQDNYIISGHTHVYNLEGKHLNPGSVGIPKVNKEHTCILYSNKTFKLINLEDLSIIKELPLNEE